MYCPCLEALVRPKDDFQGWQDLGKISGSGWEAGLPSCHLSRPGWSWLPNPCLVLQRGESLGQARGPRALLLIRVRVVIRGASWGQGSALRDPGLADLGWNRQEVEGQVAAVGPPGVWQDPGRNHHTRWVLGYSPPGRLLRAWLTLLEQGRWSLIQATSGRMGSPVEEGGQDSQLSMLGVCPPSPASPSGPEEAALFTALQGFPRVLCALPGSTSLEQSSQAGHPHWRTALEAEAVLGWSCGASRGGGGGQTRGPRGLLAEVTATRWSGKTALW